MKHELKIWPMFFEAILSGKKTWEYRINDRGFEEGDTLVLREWIQQDEKYTGRKITVRVPYLMHVGGAVIMSIVRREP